MVADAPDGNFPIHHPDPTQEKYMLEFEKFIVENNCDMGIAFDGDADRVIVFDETGNLYFGDEFMIEYATFAVKALRHLLKKKKGGKSL